MKIAKVCGNIVSSHKDEGFRGRKLLIIQPCLASGKKRGNPLIATDSIGAGSDELVIYIDSSEACIPFKTDVKYVPTDATVVGIIDELDF
ncbi:MAG: EutN/CcmL family microcompartment protein [Candidatus Muiribacteriota bacterium]